MTSADYLLRNHKNYNSLEKMLEVQIQHLVENPIQTTEADAFIESLMLSGRPIDGVIHHSSRHGSKTEEVALSYQDKLIEQRANHIETLQHQLKQVQYYIRLYDAVVAGLDPVEKWIVECHYVQSLSFNEMIRISPDSMTTISKSTLCRKKNELLRRIDHYIMIVQAPMGRTTEHRLYATKRKDGSSRLRTRVQEPTRVSNKCSTIYKLQSRGIYKPLV